MTTLTSSGGGGNTNSSVAPIDLFPSPMIPETFTLPIIEMVVKINLRSDI